MRFLIDIEILSRVMQHNIIIHILGVLLFLAKITSLIKSKIAKVYVIHI